jgi:hypothetical protein
MCDMAAPVTYRRHTPVSIARLHSETYGSASHLPRAARRLPAREHGGKLIDWLLLSGRAKNLAATSMLARRECPDA